MRVLRDAGGMERPMQACIKALFGHAVSDVLQMRSALPHQGWVWPTAHGGLQAS